MAALEETTGTCAQSWRLADVIARRQNLDEVRLQPD
jgi:hypothetical protein